MTQPVRERVHPGTTVDPVEPDAALARKNLVWGFALLGIFLLLAVGTVVVALIYNAVAEY